MAKSKGLTFNARYLNVAIFFLFVGSIMFFLEQVKNLPLMSLYLLAFVVAAVFFVSSFFGAKKSAKEPLPHVEDLTARIRASRSELPSLEALPTFDAILAPAAPLIDDSKAFEPNKTIELDRSIQMNSFKGEKLPLHKARLAELKQSLLTEFEAERDRIIAEDSATLER